MAGVRGGGDELVGGGVEMCSAWVFETERMLVRVD